MLIKDLATKDLRLDGRKFDETRDIHLETFNNMLVLKSGNRTSDSYVIFSYKKSITKPFPDKPSEGIFQINLEKGKKNDILLNFLHNAYTKSKCISMSDLCIQFNKSVYCVSIEIFPIQVNGDLFRLCVEGINKILEILELKTYFKPKIIQYAGIGQKIFIDSTENEILSCDWQLNVVMKSTREFLMIEKVGTGIPMDCFSAIITEAMTKLAL